MAGANTHNANISVNVTLEDAPITTDAFQRACLFVDASDSDLSGALDRLCFARIAITGSLAASDVVKVGLSDGTSGDLVSYTLASGTLASELPLLATAINTDVGASAVALADVDSTDTYLSLLAKTAGEALTIKGSDESVLTLTAIDGNSVDYTCVSPANSTAYSLSFWLAGQAAVITVSDTTDSSATATELASQLAVVVNANSTLAAAGVTASAASAVLTINFSGFGLVVAVGGTGCVVTPSLVAASANTLDTGVFLVTKEYTSKAEAKDDNDAGILSDDHYAAVLVAFAQDPAPDAFRVVSINPAIGAVYFPDAGFTGSYPWDQYLSSLEAITSTWFALCADWRSGAYIQDIGEAVEAFDRDIIYLAQTSDRKPYTTTAFAADTNWAAIDNYERTGWLYHDVDSEYADVAWAAGRMTFDLDETSPSMEAVLKSVATYNRKLTASQFAGIKANHGNLVAQYPTGSANPYLSPGVNAVGRPFYEIITKYWFIKRLTDAMANTRVSFTSQGKKIPVNREGQNIALGVLKGVVNKGITAGHFELDPNMVIEPLAITNTDLALGRLRFRAILKLAVDATLFEFNVNMTRSALGG